MISDSFGTLAEFKEIIKEKLPLPDEKARCFAEDRNESLTKPSGSLARLEEIAIWLLRFMLAIDFFCCTVLVCKIIDA
jgi:hypothetical protein